jgi:hypothetical protein
MNDETIDIFVEILEETNDAFCISDGDREGWIGKTLVANLEDIEGCKSGEIRIPVWKAEELEMV